MINHGFHRYLIGFGRFKLFLYMTVIIKICSLVFILEYTCLQETYQVITTIHIIVSLVIIHNDINWIIFIKNDKHGNL